MSIFHERYLQTYRKKANTYILSGNHNQIAMVALGAVAEHYRKLRKANQ